MECYSYNYWESYKKRPLENTWTLWCFVGSSKNGKTIWEECLREVGSFSTIEDFYLLFYSLVPPVEAMRPGTDYSLFKKGIRPMWEDKMNKDGGRWVMNLESKDFQPHLVDQFWLEMATCLINECFFGYNDQICGVTLNVRRRGNRLCLWTRDAVRDMTGIINIGLKFKELLGFPPSRVITYQSHKDCQMKSSPAEAKNTYYV